MTFFKKYDELASKLSKFFRTKKNIHDTAILFDQLSLMQDHENPFEAALAGAASYGAVLCFQKVQDLTKTVQTAVTAARHFLRAADYNYQISKCLKETWQDPLSDGLHCYRVAINLLKENNKPYLATQIIMELAAAESRFELVHSAGNTYEEAVDVIMTGKAPLPLLFNAVTSAISAYNKADRYELALNVVEKVQGVILEKNPVWVAPSPLMKRQFQDVNIYHAILLLMAYRTADCIKLANEHLPKELASLFRELADATDGHLIYKLDLAIEKLRATNKLAPQHVFLLDKHLQILSKSVEQGFANVMG